MSFLSVKVLIALGVIAVTYGASFTVDLASLGTISSCVYIQIPFSESESILQSITFSGVSQTYSSGGSWVSDFSIYFSSGNPTITKQATFGVKGPNASGCGVSSTQLSPLYSYTGNENGIINDQTLDVQAYNIPLTGLGIYMGNGYSGGGGGGTIGSWAGSIVIVTSLIGPSSSPTIIPSSPTVKPSSPPIVKPSSSPTVKPSSSPTVKTSSSPTVKPSLLRTTKPSSSPTVKPSSSPTVKPSSSPTVKPSSSPTVKPSSSSSPTRKPSPKTTKLTSIPSRPPVTVPTKIPTKAPTVRPTNRSTKVPSIKPTALF